MNNRTQRKRVLWTPNEVDYLIRHYPDALSSVIAEKLNRPLYSVHNKAAALGIRKSEAFNNGTNSGRLNGVIGSSTRFKKGLIPWNKGKNIPSKGRSTETQFKKGQLGFNHKPVGSTRIDVEGYVYEKVAEPNKWRPQHTLNWIAANGPVSKGYCLYFKDGNKTNTVLSNLELITRAENMRRNSIHNYPEPIVKATQMRAVLNRAINRREKNEQKH